MVDEPGEHEDLFQPSQEPDMAPASAQEPQPAVAVSEPASDENAPETLPMMTSMPPQNEVKVEKEVATPLIFTDHAPIPTRNGVPEDLPNHKKNVAAAVTKNDFTPLSMDQLPSDPSIGTILHLAREVSGYSMEQVRDQTHISLDFIARIESDKAAETIPAVYLSAYYKALCSLYRLSDEMTNMLMERHRRSMMEKDGVAQELIQQLRSEALVNEAEEKRVARIFTASVILFVLLLLLGIWAVVAAVVRHESSDENVPSAVAVQTEAVAPAAPVIAPQERFDQKELEILNAEQITDLYTLEMGRNPVIHRDWSRKR